MNMSATQTQSHQSIICLVEVRPESSYKYYVTEQPSGEYVDSRGIESAFVHLPRGKHLVKLEVAVDVMSSHLEPLEEKEMEEEF